MIIGIETGDLISANKIHIKHVYKHVYTYVHVRVPTYVSLDLSIYLYFVYLSL